jgi:hypothetical protein
MVHFHDGSRDVLICDGCGRGFLVYPLEGIDPDPLWAWPGGNIGGGICGAAILVLSRSTAIEIADRYEKIGADEWLRGKRRP